MQYALDLDFICFGSCKSWVEVDIVLLREGREIREEGDQRVKWSQFTRKRPNGTYSENAGYLII